MYAGLTAALAVDFQDLTEPVSDEICVAFEREVRDDVGMPERAAGYVVPEAWARARATLGRGRLPSGDYPSAAFVQWLKQPDPPPEGEAPLALVVETAPHPLHGDRVLVRVGLRAPDATERERSPVHLVALVSVSHTMRSVPTRTYPLLQDLLPNREDESFFFPKVDRLGLARHALTELVGELPRHSVVAMAAFDRGAHITLEPTSIDRKDVVAKAIADLQPGFDGEERGLDLVLGLVDRMRSFCGDTRVIVFSDGRTGLGGDPEDALLKVAAQAASGVTVSTVAAATGHNRVPQLEQLAWVGYGKHHYADTLGDAVQAFQSELAKPGWIARDVRVHIDFPADAVAEVRSLDDSPVDWYFEGLPRGTHRSALYEVVLNDGADGQQLLEVRWEAGSPVPGEWAQNGAVVVGRRDVPATFTDSAKGIQLAWVAAAFADHLSGRPAPPIGELVEIAAANQREGVREDIELISLMDRAARLSAH